MTLIKYLKLVLFFTGLLFWSTTILAQVKKSQFEVDEQLDYCLRQARKALNEIPHNGTIPRMIVGDTKEWVMVKPADWTSGFFPGILWYLYEYSKDNFWRKEAEKFTGLLKPLSEQPAFDHDLGFQIFCSYGNGYRLTKDTAYRNVINRTSDTLATLFNPRIGTILSWPFRVEELGGHNTIIDNMMNLEMLSWSGKDRNKVSLRSIATRHADVTMKHHFRPDYGAYHVAVYAADGSFKKGVTYQGQSDQSMWARGQAWAIYGYTMMYKETKQQRYLDFAQKVAGIYIKRLPEDLIPYWDFDAPAIPNDTRDASAAAITAGALLDLSGFVKGIRGREYKRLAEAMLVELSSERYQSRDTNSAFLLHSRGSKNHEIDIAIAYADYYYLEALLRLKKMKNK